MDNAEIWPHFHENMFSLSTISYVLRNNLLIADLPYICNRETPSKLHVSHTKNNYLASLKTAYIVNIYVELTDL